MHVEVNQLQEKVN